MSTHRTPKPKLANFGFTIVELLIVIIVIAILVSITVVAYNGVQKNAAKSKNEADVSTLEKAIDLARLKSGDTLAEITGLTNYCTGCNCINTTDNPDGVEPRELPHSNDCWTVYENTIDALSDAAGTSLNQYKDGDARGNPYWIDENEGEYPAYPCNPDSIGYFTGNGIDLSTHDIPLVSQECVGE